LARWHERNLYLAAHPVAYPVAKLAARCGPICTVPGVGHVISDVELAKEVLAAPERFGKTGPGALSDALTGVLGARALVNMDGEEHRQLRAQLRELLTPSRVAELVERSFAGPLAALQATLAAGERADLVRLSRVVAARAVCALLGIELPARDADEVCVELHRRAVELAAVLSLATRNVSQRNLEHARQRLAALTAGAGEAFAGACCDGVLRRLRELGLGFEECRGLIGFLILAGTETTASALPRTAAMLIDTQQWPALRADRRLVARAVDEGLRLTAPVALVTRNVVADTVLGGRRLRRGQRVIVCLSNALATRAAASDPKRFNLGRETLPSAANLWFGHGPHFCLGAVLARRELEAGLSALLDAGDLEVVRRRYGRRAVFAAYARLEVARR
jgi:cytochrome P450